GRGVRLVDDVLDDVDDVLRVRHVGTSVCWCAGEYRRESIEPPGPQLAVLRVPCPRWVVHRVDGAVGLEGLTCATEPRRQRPRARVVRAIDGDLRRDRVIAVLRGVVVVSASRVDAISEDLARCVLLRIARDPDAGRIQPLDPPVRGAAAGLVEHLGDELVGLRPLPLAERGEAVELPDIALELVDALDTVLLCPCDPRRWRPEDGPDDG